MRWREECTWLRDPHEQTPGGESELQENHRSQGLPEAEDSVNRLPGWISRCKRLHTASVP